jgi:hypothetical protein
MSAARKTASTRPTTAKAPTPTCKADPASIIWNARILENDHRTADAILTAYRDSGGRIDPHALHHCLIARAAVMSAWYPILYPDPSPERKSKLDARLDWLAGDP